MSTPTPRTDMATYAADCLGTTLVTNRDCSRALERELTALTTERDQLRAEVEAANKHCDILKESNSRACAEVERLSAIGSWSHTCIHHTDEERKAWAACPCCAIARAERAEAALHAATEECTDVRLKWHAVMGTCAAKEDAIIESDEELARLRAENERLKDGGVQRIKDALATTLDERAAAIARAKRAEAEVERLKTGGIVELAAVNSSVLEYCKHWEARAERAEAELATERARLDYLLRWDPTFNSREDIDRDMQEAAK